MKLNPLLHYCLFALIAIVIVSCANLPPSLQSAMQEIKPTVSLSDASITQLSLNKADINLKLKINNPNAVPLKMAGFDYAVLLNGIRFTEGKQRKGISIDAKGSSEISIPLSFVFAELYDSVKQLKDKKSVDYEIQTTALFQLPILGPLALPAKNTGQFPIPQLPKVALKNISVDKLGLTGAKVTAQMQLDNPNIFGIDIRDFAYQLNINQQSWAKGNVEQTISLKENAAQTLSIPISLDFLSMGSSIMSVLSNTNNPLDYQLSGNMTLDSTLPMLKNIKLPFDHIASIALSK